MRRDRARAHTQTHVLPGSVWVCVIIYNRYINLYSILYLYTSHHASIVSETTLQTGAFLANAAACKWGANRRR